MHLGGWLLVCARLGACLTLFYGGSIHLWIMIMIFMLFVASFCHFGPV